MRKFLNGKYYDPYYSDCLATVSGKYCKEKGLGLKEALYKTRQGKFFLEKSYYGLTLSIRLHPNKVSEELIPLSIVQMCDWCKGNLPLEECHRILSEI